MARDAIFFIDVDDTFVRSFGNKRIPIPGMLKHIQHLKDQGAKLYCWSSGGAIYAKESAQEFNIEECFIGFLPKPTVLIDDIEINQWNNLIQVHPNSAQDLDLEDYLEKLK